MKRFDLNNKVMLITGASGGVSQAVARPLHDHGAKQVLTDIT